MVEENVGGDPAQIAATLAAGRGEADRHLDRQQQAAKLWLGNLTEQLAQFHADCLLSVPGTRAPGRLWAPNTCLHYMSMGAEPGKMPVAQQLQWLRFLAEPPCDAAALKELWGFVLSTSQQTAGPARRALTVHGHAQAAVEVAERAAVPAWVSSAPPSVAYRVCIALQLLETTGVVILPPVVVHGHTFDSAVRTPLRPRRIVNAILKQIVRLVPAYAPDARAKVQEALNTTLAAVCKPSALYDPAPILADLLDSWELPPIVQPLVCDEWYKQMILSVFSAYPRILWLQMYSRN